MPVRAIRDPGFLYKRKIDKIVGGARVDWNSGPVVRRIEDTIAKMNRKAAFRLKAVAKVIVRQRAYDTGDLHRSIGTAVSKYEYSGFARFYKKVHSEWLVWAGNSEVDYAGHVELGRYFKNSGTRVAAVPYMRKAAANTRKWLRPKMKAALKRAIK